MATINVVTSDDPELGRAALDITWQNLADKPYAADPTFDATTDVANLNAAITTSKANRSKLYIPGGVYSLDETIDLGREAGAGYQPGFNMEGQGRNATYFYVADDVSGITLSNMGVNDGGSDWMQYGNVGAFTIEYPNLQHRDNVESWAFGTSSGSSHSVFHEILVNNAFNGIYTVDLHIGASTQPSFQNSWRDLRIFNCWKGLILDGDTSGCLIENVYVSAPSRPSMLVMVDSWGMGNQFLRLNTEHTNVRDVIFDSILGSNISIEGWHMEGLSMATAGQACYAGNGRGYDRPNGAVSRHAWYATSGQGHQSINNWSVDSCFMGPHLVKPYGLTRSGTTCRIEFLYMASALREHSGLGMEVGDNIFIEGADTTTSNEYNGTHVVTAVSEAPSTTPWLEFEIASGTPASPADVVSGADAIAVNIGSSLLYSIPIIQANGAASSVTVDGLHIRDMKITGSTPARRTNMVRALNGGASAVQVSFKNINNGSQQHANGGWPKPATIVGVGLSSNVVEFWFLNKHHLRNEDSIRVTGLSAYGADDVFSGGTITSPYSVTYPLVRADFGRTGVTASVVRNAVTISKVARDDNYTTITTVEDTKLSGRAEPGEGMQVSVVCVEDDSFSVVNAQILGLPDAHTILIRNEGTDIAEKSQTGSVMIIDQPFGGTSFDESTQNGAVLMEFGEIDDYCTVTSPATITAETTTDLRLLNVNRADANKDVVEIVGVHGLDPLCTVTGYVYGWNQVLLQVTNPTASSVALGSMVVHYKVTRK